jgi:hypothetical protein
MNDCVGYHIINPWQQNLKEIATILRSIPELRINRSSTDNGVIRLVGTTDMSTSYEIVLWPTLLAQYARWVERHPESSEEQRQKLFKQMTDAQRAVEDSDSTMR